MIHLARLKFSSNVIEKCLENELSHREIENLLTSESLEERTILNQLGPFVSTQARVNFIVDSLAFDLFGNYVLQKLLQVKLESSVKFLILQAITDRREALSATVSGQKLVSRVRAQHPGHFGKNENRNPKRRANNKKVKQYKERAWE